MTRASSWWKCDLQIATPPYNFQTAGHSFDWSQEADCRRFAAQYVEHMVDQGLQLVALANHNRADQWIDYMRDAAAGSQLAVLPGVEVTSGSGSDGVHLVVLTDAGTPAADLDRLLHGPCGFGRDHPLFLSNGDPAPSPKTADQILDGLDDRFLAIAPHAMNDNGIASGRSVRGSIRWKALHHSRLAALDLPDGHSMSDDPSWSERFKNRDLDDFPCLRWLPFIATSDAYSVERAGQRFTWIRMAEPSLEGLRQAMLDHESRVIPSWDERLRVNPDPNAVGHAWIEGMTMRRLGNTDSSLELSFDPHLNVIIGGRGSGKSTVVNGLLQLYGSGDSPQDLTTQEAESFAREVLADATIEANH